MQICALYSQTHKHKEAAVHADQAIELAHYLIHDSENMCATIVKELIGEKSINEVSIIGELKHSLLQKTAVKLLPIFQTILRKVAIEDERDPSNDGVPITGPLQKTHYSLKEHDKSKVAQTALEESNRRLGSGLHSLEVGPADMKNILGYLNQNEWIYSLNIGNIMQVTPLTLQDFLAQNQI